MTVQTEVTLEKQWTCIPFGYEKTWGESEKNLICSIQRVIKKNPI